MLRSTGSLIRMLGAFSVACTLAVCGVPDNAENTAVVQGAEAAAALAQCSGDQVRFDEQWRGTYRCVYGEKFHKFHDGTVEVFVIDVDYGVTTKWRRKDGKYSNWVNMGAYSVYHTPPRPKYFQLLHCNGQPYLNVFKSDHHWWFNYRTSSGSWTGWHRGRISSCG